MESLQYLRMVHVSAALFHGWDQNCRPGNELLYIYRMPIAQSI